MVKNIYSPFTVSVANDSPFTVLSQHLDDPLRPVPHVLADLHVESRFQEEFFPFFHLAAVHPDDDGEGAVDLACGLDDSLGNDVATHDASENVDEDTFDVAILENDLERLGDLFPGGSPPNVEEVGGLAANLVKNVEGRHGEPGAVYHAADVPLQLDVGEVVLAGIDFEGVELGVVEHVGVFPVAEHGVVVEVDFGVHRHQPPRLGDHQRVDLYQIAVLLQAGPVQVEDQVDAILADAPLEPECQGNLACLVGT